MVQPFNGRWSLSIPPENIGKPLVQKETGDMKDDINIFCKSDINAFYKKRPVT